VSRSFLSFSFSSSDNLLMFNFTLVVSKLHYISAAWDTGTSLPAPTSSSECNLSLQPFVTIVYLLQSVTVI
jgi:hypothetical protein